MIMSTAFIVVTAPKVGKETPIVHTFPARKRGNGDLQTFRAPKCEIPMLQPITFHDFVAGAHRSASSRPRQRSGNR